MKRVYMHIYQAGGWWRGKMSNKCTIPNNKKCSVISPSDNFKQIHMIIKSACHQPSPPIILAQILQTDESAFYPHHHYCIIIYIWINTNTNKSTNTVDKYKYYRQKYKYFRQARVHFPPPPLLHYHLPPIYSWIKQMLLEK